MKKKNDPPPARTRPPAMFVGDEMPPDAPLVPEQARYAAALLPDDLRVVTEGTSAGRLPLLAAGLVVLALFGVGVAYTTYPYPSVGEGLGVVGLITALCAAIGAVGHRAFVAHRKEFRLDAHGIVMEVWHRADTRPWLTCIPWPEIENYTVSVTPNQAVLHVTSVRDYTLTLRDRPARLSTRELIRRFVEQAERYPRAVRPGVAVTETGYVPSSIVDERDTSIRGCVTYIGGAMVFILGIPMLRLLIEIPRPTVGGAIAVVATATLVSWGWIVWMARDDYDIALADRGSRKTMTRLRRWLRRVLNVDPL